MLYHEPCPDGGFSALAAYLYFSKRQYDVTYAAHATFRTSPAAENFKGQQVYLCDYVGPKGYALELAQHAEKVIILDHHKTALD